MPSDPEEIQDDAVDRQESLRLSGGLEPAHLALSLSRRLMRDFGPVVRTASGVVNHRRHGASPRRAVARQLVGDQSPRFAALAFQQLAKEAFGRTPIAPRLDEDIDDISVLVNSAPEILPLALGRQDRNFRWE